MDDDYYDDDIENIDMTNIMNREQTLTKPCEKKQTQSHKLSFTNAENSNKTNTAKREKRRTEAWDRKRTQLQKLYFSKGATPMNATATSNTSASMALLNLLPFSSTSEIQYDPRTAAVPVWRRIQEKQKREEEAELEKLIKKPKNNYF